MVRKYTLYLDESGDFDRDLEASWKNECLIGGLLLREGRPLREERAREIVAGAWKKAFPEDAGRSAEVLFARAAHATELRENKAKIVRSVLEEAERYGDFVIFENYNKTRIVNSTLTYINIMVDGIIQLAGRLAAEHPGDKAKLEVIAGFRKDTTVSVSADRTEGYIRKEEFTERIRERLSLAQVKNHLLSNRNGEILFRCDDDKANPCLVVCDYICNFYITRTAAVYRESYDGRISLGEYLLVKYKECNRFSLQGDVRRERVADYINRQNYDIVLYDICTGIVDKKENADRILNAFLCLPEKARENYLQSLGNYFNNLIGGERNLALGGRALKAGEEIAEALRAAGKEDIRFTLNIVLYRLAVCNHQGRLDEMEELFGRCRELLSRALNRTEYLDYAFLYYNRYAVYLTDTLRVQEAVELLEQAERCFEAYELIIEELPGLKAAGEKIRSEQLGRLLGTKVQCMRYLLSRGKCTYEEAAAVSGKALENFSREADLRRQYQYRGQIEAAAGRYEEALSYLCKGFGVQTWQELFVPEVLRDEFAAYQLSFFVKEFAGKETPGEYTEILKRLRSQESVFLGKKGYPEFAVCGNCAYAMEQSGFDANAAKRYYKSVIEGAVLEEDGPLLFLLKMMIGADYAAMVAGRQETEARKAADRLREGAGMLGSVILPEGLKGLPGQLEEACRREKPEEFRRFAALRQY